MEGQRRLIEDYLPIEAISKEASREKSIRKGHISTLHLWWARRPLVACRAAVYGALVPADQFRPRNGPEEKRESLGRANAAKFVERLCKYPGDPRVIAEAQSHILEAHAQRLTDEIAEWRKSGNAAPKPAWMEEFSFTGDRVTVEDIVGGRAPRPRVLDMFAGGGSIPLEALRLGCEAYALDLNPVAYIIELCTLVYPQKYGKPDQNSRGMTGPRNEKGQTTWGGLAEEVRYWGNWVLEKVKAEIGDLYPPIPDPDYDIEGSPTQASFDEESDGGTPPGFLTPVAYLWTRTVRCKNPTCGATVPLVRQTWLCKKKGRYVALRVVASKGKKQVRFEVAEATSEDGLGFDPAAGSKGGNATCPFCSTVADSDYVKAEGCAARMGHQLMSTVCMRPGASGKFYITGNDVLPAQEAIGTRTKALCENSGLTVPPEPITTDAKNCCWTYLYGMTTFKDLFLPRQLLCMLSFSAAARASHRMMLDGGYDPDRARAVASYLGILVDRLADYSSSGCTWEPGGQFIGHTFTRQAIPVVWDFAELAPFGDASGSPRGAIHWIVAVIKAEMGSGGPANVERGSAMSLPWLAQAFDAVVTDPPYYDNVSYADLSDFFYVWLRRTLGDLFPEHFASEGSPKKAEAVADATRHAGERERSRAAYEEMMASSFREANRVLKPGGQMVVVYAHKTTLGWSTLVDAMRASGFTVTEAWPLDTERSSRFRAQGSAALASSIFLVARKRPVCPEARQFTTDERRQLQLFCGVCDQARGCRFWKMLPTMNHSIHSRQREDGLWETTYPDYDEDDFRSFMTFVRKLVAEKEPTNLNRVINILSRRADARDQEALRDIKTRLRAEETRFGGITVTIPTLAGPEVIEPRKMRDLLFNAEVFHTDLDKQEGWLRLRDHRGPIYPLFVRHVSIIVAQASRIAGVIKFRGYASDERRVGQYENDVRPALERIVRERVETLWVQGITGADLVIAAVGAGLRAFTRFARVEYANGEEVPAEKFLAEVEGVVLETLMQKIFRVGRSGVAAVDGPSRFYVLWRYMYRVAQVDAGEAIVFAYGQPVELEELAGGPKFLVEKKKGKYRVRDFTERGNDEKLGLPKDDGTPAPLIDVLHRILWLVANQPSRLNEFLDGANPDEERLRLVAHTLAGPALAGTEKEAGSLIATTSAEQSALRTLLQNWRTLIEQRVTMLQGTLFDERRGEDRE